MVLTDVIVAAQLRCSGYFRDRRNGAELTDLSPVIKQPDHVVPFLVEDELKKLGGIYEKAADWQSFVTVDEAPRNGTESCILDSSGQTLHNQEPAFKGSSRKENFQ